MTEQAKELNRFWDTLGVFMGSLRDAHKFIVLCLNTGIVPCLIGESGIGKSQLWKQVGEDLDYHVWYLFLAHRQPEDLTGIPFPEEGGAYYRFLCESTIREIIESKKNGIIVLDEWNRGTKDVMNAAFTMMEDRMYGSHKLPDNIFIGAAMNPSEGNYLVSEAEKDPAFRRRLAFLGIRADPAVWLEYALGRGGYHRYVTNYIQTQPQALIDVQARDAGKVSASPAQWEKVSNIFWHLEREKADLQKELSTIRLVMGGIVGTGTTEQFIAWWQENASLVNPTDVLFNYASSGARDRIKMLIEKGRNDAVMETCEAVALTLITSEPDVDDVADNLGPFLNDLPEDAALAFISKIGRHVAQLEKAEYEGTLSRRMKDNEEYRNALLKIHEAQIRVKDDIENGNGDDDETKSDAD